MPERNHSMYDLTDINQIRAIMKRFGKNFSKSLGQNFLTSPETIDKIVEGSGVGKETPVLEIGPGVGVLTAALAQAAEKVVTVELDAKLLPVLEYTLSDFDTITIVNEDILKLDLPALCAERFGGKKAAVVANLPYYITTPILMRLLEEKECFSSITVMVQKEVAQRMAAAPGSKDYCSLSIAVQYHAEAKLLTVVPPEFFVPPPKVSSAVVRLDILEKPSVECRDHKLFFRLVRASFAQRRKTLVNGIANAGIGFSKQQVTEALEGMGLDPSIRGERLSLEQFALLADRLC